LRRPCILPVLATLFWSGNWVAGRMFAETLIIAGVVIATRR
jgi:hypothetical protein